jgi:2-polyprenyl-3-methyl-5-hydroxy-6-metoxy-1,4-benzoquinol methylase
MRCLFCDSNDLKDSYLPSTFFNGKRFDYSACKDCGLHFITPLPNDEDLLKMYPPSYQNGLDRTIMKDPSEKLIGLRFSYGFQFDLLNNIGFNGKMLDFGCGNANFLLNAKHHGFYCDGLEFNPKHVAILKEEISEQQFYTFEELIEGNQKYDLIRLSNVFEHFTDPKESMKSLIKCIRPGGYLLVEGPIENNFNLALQYRKLYFNLRKLLNKNYVANHSPTHIIFSKLTNQVDLFEGLGLESQYIKVTEAEWPFPNSLKRADNMIQKLNFMVARISMFLSHFNAKWGNTFIYLGKIK